MTIALTEPMLRRLKALFEDDLSLVDRKLLQKTTQIYKSKETGDIFTDSEWH
jgi:hypothetical protein